MLDYATLCEGEQVAVSRHGNEMTHNEGLYTVVKANKMKVVLKRDSDGHTREFSVKRRVELGRSEFPWSRAFIETLKDLNEREEQYKKTREIKHTWALLEEAAQRKNLDTVKALVANWRLCNETHQGGGSHEYAAQLAGAMLG